MNVGTGLPVRNIYSIPMEGTDTVVPVQVVTVPSVVLRDIQASTYATVTYPMVVQFLSSQVVAKESMIMANT